MVCAHKVNEDALRFLVLSMNSQQGTFEYEFLPCWSSDAFVKALSGRAGDVDRKATKREAPAFCERYSRYLETLVQTYGLAERPPDSLVLLTTARFSDHYYAAHEGDLSVVALGNWKRWMAPPSLIEFSMTLLVRESVAMISPSFEGSIHLGTKGCLFDFTAELTDARHKVLNGFICSYCRKLMAKDGSPGLADELETVLRRDWLGSPTDPESPASIASNLGYDLFRAKGLKATPWESFKHTFSQEGAKQATTVVAGLLFTALVVVLGLR
jgi:hypothetical protein